MTPSRQSGLTLLELVVVIGLLSVLFGLGLGALQSGGRSGLATAESLLRDHMRRAALSARARSLPAEVRFEAAEPGRSAALSARVLEPFGQWHLEPRERQLFAALSPVLGGESVAGRFGMGRRSLGGEQGDDLLRVAGIGSLPAFDLHEGFALRLDVYLEGRQAAGRLLTLGDSLALRFDQDGELRVELELAGFDPERGGARPRLGFGAIRPDRWATVTVVHDGAELRALVDGTLRGRVPAEGSLLQQGGEDLVLVPAGEELRMRVDELQLLAFTVTPPQDLPPGVTISLPEDGERLRFDRYGDVLGSATEISIEDATSGDRLVLGLRGGGILQ